MARKARAQEEDGGMREERWVYSLEAIKQTQSWYDIEIGPKLRRLALELVSESPSVVHAVCEALVKALSEGMKRAQRVNGEIVLERDPKAERIKLGGTVWETRTELKARCQEVLRRYPEEGRLDDADLVFMRALLVHHPRGQEKLAGCQAMAVGVHPLNRARCFYVVRANGREDFSYVRCVDNAPTEEITAQRQICDALWQILKLHPSSRDHLACHIEESFPSYYGSQGLLVEKHRNWTICLLELAARNQTLTDFLLRVLVRKMLELDAWICKIEAGEVVDADERPRDDKAAPVAALGGGRVDQARLNALANILDAMMMLLFEFLQRHLAGDVGESENFLASVFFQIFDTLVLLTPQSRCVQFLWFYLVSLRPAWTEAFLTMLVSVAFSPNAALGKRLASLAYLASFIARAKFLTKKFTLRTAQFMSLLAKDHLQSAEGHLAAGSWSHPQLVLFLYTIQCMCYTICFHAAEFATSEPNMSPRRTALNSLLEEGCPELDAHPLAPMLESPANPIARINRQVADQFCKCLKSYHPLVASMLRRRLQDAEKVMAAFCQGDTAGMELFFPFDPYRLKHSAIFVLSMYRDWAEDDDSNVDPGEGFAKAVVTQPRARSESMASNDEEERSDVDFTDARDANERGFVASIGPSPAFQPRRTCDVADIMSPLCMPMSSMDDDDGFALPSASVPLDGGSSSMLLNLINTPAYREGRG